MKGNLGKRIFAGMLAAAVGMAEVFLGVFGFSISTAAARKNVIITIDPGHGGSERGAYLTRNGVLVCEKDLNLTIAKFMKKELETYQNVTVYLTRSDDRTVSLERRVAMAASYHSDLLFSVHNNATGDSSHEHSGAFALVPSGRYHKELSKVTAKIGAFALQNVTKATGIANRGYLKRFSAQRRYPNGRKADYYAIVRGGIEYGIPAMIMEHGFMDNDLDWKRMDSEEDLKVLGEADANAVARYFGLKKKDGSKKYKKAGPRIRMISRFWMLKDGERYYVNSQEQILTGWVRINGYRYHFKKTGAASNGFQKIGQNYYYFNEYGRVQTGWQKIQKKWYFFQYRSGKAYRNGKLKLGKKVYRFAKNGVCKNR